MNNTKKELLDVANSLGPSAATKQDIIDLIEEVE